MRAKFTVSEEHFHQMTPAQFDAFVKLCIMDAGQVRADNFICENKLSGKCWVGVIGVSDPTNTKLLAAAKVMVHGSLAFMHEELYSEFPSDHFKTKVILACG